MGASQLSHFITSVSQLATPAAALPPLTAEVIQVWAGSSRFPFLAIRNMTEDLPQVLDSFYLVLPCITFGTLHESGPLLKSFHGPKVPKPCWTDSRARHSPFSSAHLFLFPLSTGSKGHRHFGSCMVVRSAVSHTLSPWHSSRWWST